MTEPSEARAAFTIAKAMAQSTATVPLPPNAAERLPPAKATLLLPPRRRSFVIPVMAFGFAALLVAIGIKRQDPVEPLKPQSQSEAASLAAIGINEQFKQPEPQPQTEFPDSVQPEQYEDGLNKLRSSFASHSRKQPVKPVDTFKSYALDVAQLYLSIASFSKATTPPTIENTQKTR
jgi:hypothetical protein